MFHKYSSLILLTISIFALSCQENYIPKPRGYFRIGFPQKEYKAIDTLLPYRFEMPVYAEVLPDDTRNTQPYWINVSLTGMNAKLYISYHPVHNNLNQILEDSHELAYKHAIKADAIDEQVFINNEKKVYGIFYTIAGNAATPMQFYLTDSVHHYLRGALYFNNNPNKDSLAPVIDFLKPDIIHLIETFNWNELNKLN